MTFDEARQVHLAAFDRHVAALREVVANPRWRLLDKDAEYTNAHHGLDVVIANLNNLNAADLYAGRQAEVNRQ